MKKLPDWVSSVVILVVLAASFIGIYRLANPPKPVDPMEAIRQADRELQEQAAVENQKQTRDEKVRFVGACILAVKQQLKNPDGAKFGTFGSEDVEGTSGSYYLGYYVDATNSLGATIRTAFRCDQEGDRVRAQLFE